MVEKDSNALKIPEKDKQYSIRPNGKIHFNNRDSFLTAIIGSIEKREKKVALMPILQGNRQNVLQQLMIQKEYLLTTPFPCPPDEAGAYWSKICKKYGCSRDTTLEGWNTFQHVDMEDYKQEFLEQERKKDVPISKKEDEGIEI